MLVLLRYNRRLVYLVWRNAGRGLLNVLYIAMKLKQYSHVTQKLVTKESSLKLASIC